MTIKIITVYLQADAIKSVAQTLVQASGYIGTYLSQGWQKMIEPAAIALATALAMGLVELAMELGFKAIGTGVKKAGQAVKKGVGAAASGVKNVVGAGAKGIKSLLKSGAKLASKSGSMIIRNGKIVIKSLQKGLMKGAKNLRGLLDRILQKFKFKKFKLVRKGKHIRLYGEVNPWVLLADGTMKDIKEQDFNKEFKKLKKDGMKPVELDRFAHSNLKKLDDIERLKVAELAGGNKASLNKIITAKSKLANKLDATDDISEKFDLKLAKEHERKIGTTSTVYNHDKGNFGEEVARIVAKQNNLGDDVSSLFQKGRNGLDGAFLSKGPPPKLTIIEAKTSERAHFVYSDAQKSGGGQYFEKMRFSNDPRYAGFNDRYKQLKEENYELEIDFIRVEADLKKTDIGFGVDELKIRDWSKRIE
ncbi:hypothetical protein NYE24_07275 [Paenibacillus sp. FSL H7-0350]|uniref:hypothetical protein n=1 Tax=unclassified Paenibacillus TaxID=185978 RepID=UPI0003E27E2B|nr:hypothetical protein [Paenibacillus sp. FSL R7-269]ETT34060.1 hypothetical protein C162_30055 [Paenibacillus sp. FSL R7-269]